MATWLRDDRPARVLLAQLDELRSGATSLPSLTDLDATTYREGEHTVLAFEAGTCVVLPPPVAPPWPITEGFDFDPPSSFAAFMAIANGMELSSVVGTPAAGEVTRQYTRFFTGAGREAFESWRDSTPSVPSPRRLWRTTSIWSRTESKRLW